MHFVISTVTAKWFVNGKVENVKPGDVVGFDDPRDAEHFLSDGRAEAVAESDVDAALAEGGTDMLKQKLDNKAMRTDSGKAPPVGKAPAKKPAEKKPAKPAAKRGA